MFWEFKSANVVAKEDQGPQYKLDSLTFQVADTDRFEETLDQVHTILDSTHRGIEDFTFDTRQEFFDSMEENMRNTRMSGGVIAGISLIVGGIGITNIMLASITERIREIGVRRAVGAKGRDIFVQIVVESAVIGIIGGLLGLVASVGVMQILIAISPEANAPVVELGDVLDQLRFRRDHRRDQRHLSGVESQPPRSDRGAALRLNALGNQLVDHVAVDVREAEIAAGVAVSEVLVIEA